MATSCDQTERNAEQSVRCRCVLLGDNKHSEQRLGKHIEALGAL